MPPGYQCPEHQTPSLYLPLLIAELVVSKGMQICVCPTHHNVTYLPGTPSGSAQGKDVEFNGRAEEASEGKRK